MRIIVLHFCETRSATDERGYQQMRTARVTRARDAMAYMNDLVLFTMQAQNSQLQTVVRVSVKAQIRSNHS